MARVERLPSTERFLPSFALPQPEKNHPLRVGFLVASLCLPLAGLMILMGNPESLEKPTPTGEGSIPARIGQEISIETSSPSPRRSGPPEIAPETSSLSGSIRKSGEKPDLDSVRTGEDDQAVDAPRPVTPYKPPQISDQTPIALPVKTRPLPTPSLPGPDLKEVKRTGLPPRP
jgi:hypothetical protein